MIRTRKPTEKKQEQYFQNLADEGVKAPAKPGGVSKDTIKYALGLISRDTDDLVDVVSCLLDDFFPSLFSADYKLSHGAGTAHIGCYVGIFMRHGNKLDREGRDYWIKPLSEVGVIQKLTFDSTTNQFLAGHLKAKSPNSAYCLDPGFVTLLKKNDRPLLATYFEQNTVARRLKVQAQVIEKSEMEHGKGSHYELIRLVQETYVVQFLGGYHPIYVDDSDGDRISKAEQDVLSRYSIKLTIEDSWPDILLIDQAGTTLWFVEVVISDGEIDETKMARFREFCKKNQKNFGGATTCYPVWKIAAQRQSANKNLAIGSWLWIAEDGGKQLLVSSFE